MSYRVHCNWCGKQLFREDMAVLEITVERRAAASRRERDWAQEKRPTLHFCVGENLDTNRMGMSDMRVDDPDSCFTRALAAVNGRKTEQPNMGLEWRLMRVSDPTANEPASKPAVKIPDPPEDPGELVRFGGEMITAGLHHVIETRITPARKFTLTRAGITSLDQVAAMSDDELLKIDGLGHGILRELRQAIRERGIDGLTLAREVYELICEQLPLIDEADPVRSTLADALPGLATAIGRA